MKAKKIFLTILFIIMLISLIALIFFKVSSSFLDENYSIEKRIGDKNTGGSITMLDYKYIIEKTIGPYLKELREKNYEKASCALARPDHDGRRGPHRLRRLRLQQRGSLL